MELRSCNGKCWFAFRAKFIFKCWLVVDTPRYAQVQNGLEITNVNASLDEGTFICNVFKLGSSQFKRININVRVTGKGQFSFHFKPFRYQDICFKKSLTLCYKFKTWFINVVFYSSSQNYHPSQRWPGSCWGTVQIWMLSHWKATPGVPLVQGKLINR